MTEPRDDGDASAEDDALAGEVPQWAHSAGFQVARTESGAELWDASEEEPKTQPVTNVGVPVPDDQLRRWVLLWIGLGICLTIVVSVLGMAAHWLSEEYSRALLQVIVAPLLSAFIVVVGYLFGERRRR